MAIEATLPPTVEETKPSTTITVSGILGDLNNGLDRQAIAKKYNLSAAEVAEVFKHPKLKGLRARRKTVKINIIDDTEPVNNSNQISLLDSIEEIERLNHLDEV
jgi:hypothetical protein